MSKIEIRDIPHLSNNIVPFLVVRVFSQTGGTPLYPTPRIGDTLEEYSSFIRTSKMSEITPVKLQYSKVIRPTTRKTFDTYVSKETGRMVSIETGTETREYREYRETRGDIKGVITPRKIQMYRWWFRYLQLSLELEDLGYTFTENRRIKGTKKRKGYDKDYRHKVVVNRKKYEGWDLDEVLTSNFDKWWKGHSYLFVETLSKTTEILDPGDMVFDDHYRYFRIDTRMTTKDTLQSIRQHLESNRRRSNWTSKWTPTGEIRQEKLFNIYNTMVMWSQGKSTKEILTSGLFRRSRGREITYEEDLGRGGRSTSFYRGGQVEKRSSKVNSDKMRKDLLEPGRRLILIVCDGYFAKHPRNKKYFGKK